MTVGFQSKSDACTVTSFADDTKYCQTSNISYTLAGNKIVDHSDVAGASPVVTAPTTSLT